MVSCLCHLPDGEMQVYSYFLLRQSCKTKFEPFSSLLQTTCITLLKEVEKVFCRIPGLEVLKTYLGSMGNWETSPSFDCHDLEVQLADDEAAFCCFTFCQCTKMRVSAKKIDR